MPPILTPEAAALDVPRDGHAAHVRRIAAGLAALAVVVALTVWLWPRPDDPRTAATEAALRQALTVGGPPGWTTAEPAGLLPQDGQTGETETRDGALVGISRDDDAETGFTASWTTTVTGSSAGPACDALAAWAVRVVPSADTREIRTSCHDARNGGGLFAGSGTEPGERGRLMMFASADGDSVPSGAVLTTTLKFRAADPDVAR